MRMLLTARALHSRSRVPQPRYSPGTRRGGVQAAKHAQVAAGAFLQPVRTAHTLPGAARPDAACACGEQAAQLRASDVLVTDLHAI